MQIKEESFERLWFPKRVIIASAIKKHKETARILGKCGNVPHFFIDNEPKKSDAAILSSCISENDREVLSHEARYSLYLTSNNEVDQQMAAGPTKERRCFNFLKITPYKGVCQNACAYCWFKDNILLPRVNVRFFDYFKQRLIELRKKTKEDVVFTFTHYKTDCIAIEHLTGFVEKLVKLFEVSNGFHLQLLTKLHNTDFLLKRLPKKGTIVCYSLNAPEISRSIELQTSSIIQRIDAASKLDKAGIPVIFRIDPMLHMDGWRSDYNKLVNLMSSRIKPKHITIGTPRFQDLDECNWIAERVENKKARYLLMNEVNKMGVFKPGHPDPTGKAHYFKNMSVSYPENIRIEMYQYMVSLLRDSFDSNISIGLCEEPSAIWELCGLHWSGNKKKDCSCNFVA